jgi:hypothetical protein
MPRTKIEFQCLLISPSDVRNERKALTEVVTNWNAHIGATLGASINLVRWETHSMPDANAPAQASLNGQIVDECDFGIAVFWTRIGTKTPVEESGSVEEIRRLQGQGKQVLIYFNEAPVPQAALRDDQYGRLQAFKQELLASSFPATYEKMDDLREQVQLHLTSLVGQLLARQRGTIAPFKPLPVLTAPVPDVRVRAHASLVMPRDTLIPMLTVEVQNHSPVAVYLRPVCLLLKDGSRMTGLRDSATGARPIGPTEIPPGRRYEFRFSTDDVTRAGRQGGGIVCALATDDIGNEYRSDEESMVRVLRQLKIDLDSPAPSQKKGRGFVASVPVKTGRRTDN